jgi:hypothetical protein
MSKPNLAKDADADGSQVPRLSAFLNTAGGAVTMHTNAGRR